MTDPSAPIFSVLIPAFRAAKYLSQALESVAAQTVTRWEVRIHEDGILDHTSEIVHQYAARYPGRVHFTRTKTNQGVSRARNHLMKQAEGAFIAFLDADDFWSPGHLEAALKVHHQTGADWVISGYGLADADGADLGKRFVPPPHPLGEIPDALLKETSILPSGVTLRRESAWGLQFDPSLAVGEHLDFWLQLCQRRPMVGYTHRPTFFHRKHEASASADPLHFMEHFSDALLKQAGRSQLNPETLDKKVAAILNTLIRMSWRKEPRRARRALHRLQKVRTWNPSAWLRVAGSILVRPTRRSASMR